MSERPPRMMPAIPDAERAVLGALVMDPELMGDLYDAAPSDAIRSALEAVTPRKPTRERGEREKIEPLFADPRNQFIFGALCELAEKGAEIGRQTVCSLLAERGLLDSAGGAFAVTSLEADIFGIGQFPELVRILLKYRGLRQLVKVGTEIAEAATADGAEPEEIIELSEKRIFAMTGQKATGGFVSARAAMTETWSELEARRSGMRTEVGIPSGITDLDSTLLGFQPGQLIVIAARPSIGKTALALTIANHVAVNRGMGVGIFSLEMSRGEILQRLLSIGSRVNFGAIRSGRGIDPQRGFDLQQAREALDASPMHIDDGAALSPSELRSRARHLAMRENLSLIIVDYLQLMHGGKSRTENRQLEIGECSRALKLVAKEVGVPVLALSQMSRGIEARKGADAEPRLSDLRDSGCIEQDSDVVIFVTREIHEHHDVEVGQLIVAKQRNGPLGRADVRFLKRCALFTGATS